MGDTFIISGLKEKRSAVPGQIVELRGQIDRLQADLFHLDAVLKIYGLDPEDIPTKGRVPKRSAFFGRNEITRRCYDLLRERGTIKAEDVAVKAMLKKGLDPAADRKQRIDFTRRILVSLHDMKKAGTVEKIGEKRGVRWRFYSASGISNAISELKLLAAKSPFDPNAANPAPNTRTKDEEDQFVTLGHNLKCGFCIAGHLENDRLPAAYQIDIDPLTGAAKPAQLVMGNYRFWGVPNMIERLIGGYDWAIRNSIVNSPFWSGTEADYNALMLQHNLQHDSLPIRDAIDFVHTCIHSTIKSLKFSRYSQTCGGPIEIAVITSDRKFRWVRHKDWDVAITEGVAT